MQRSAPTDITLYRRLAVFVWLLGAALAAVVFIFAPPTVAVGSKGWWLAALSTAISIGIAVRIAWPQSRLTKNELSWTSFIGLAQVLLLQWLAGGLGAPYNELLLLCVFSSASLHPPRRLVLFLILAAGVAVAPFLYDGWDSQIAGATAIYLVALLCVSMLSRQFVMGTDEQKADLRAAEMAAEATARTDPLTGLGNRRAFDETLRQEISRTRRTGAPISLIVGDLDRFKLVNDRFGHVNGDILLSQAAAAIEGGMRLSDRCFRWGGDEFAILLPDTSLAAAHQVEQRVRAALEESVHAPDGTPVTISTGSAELRGDMTSDDLLDAADLAMMAAKAETRV